MSKVRKVFLSCILLFVSISVLFAHLTKEYVEVKPSNYF